jgi:putative phosphoesterase
MRLAIISDTHLPRGARTLPEECVERLTTADAILHAGDFIDLPVLNDLATLGPPLYAVHGNVDRPGVVAALPERRVVEVSGVRIGMVHDAGPAGGRLDRMRRAFDGCDAVVFGHSHIPLRETSTDRAFHLFNPGSPTDRRRQPQHTMGEALVDDGKIRFALIDLG